MIKLEFCFETVAELNAFLDKMESENSPTPVVEEEEGTVYSYTVEEITAKAVELMDKDSSFQPKLVDLLDEFNVRAVTELKPYQFYAFMKGLNDLEVGV